MTVAVTCSDSSLYDAAKKLADQLQIPFSAIFDDLFSIYLVLTPEHLQLQARTSDALGPIFVDFVGGALRHRLRCGGGCRQLIGRAVGVRPKKTLTVFDATAGLGRDAWVLANMGCDVTMIERSRVVAALLNDGLSRVTETPQFSKITLRLIREDAIQFLQTLPQDHYPDVIYVDPMFPPLKKTALVKKEMRVLKQVVGDDDDAMDILCSARNVAKKRVVVKRHRYAPTIGSTNPDLVFKGKCSRFDVYLHQCYQ